MKATNATTIAQLKAVIADLPDDMPVNQFHGMFNRGLDVILIPKGGKAPQPCLRFYNGGDLKEHY